MSYRCMPNMARKISSHNSVILNNNIRTVADETSDSDFSDSDADISEEENDSAESDAENNADDNTNQPSTCNCRNRDRSNCPLKGNCLACCLVYRATVTRLDNCHCETYTGVFLALLSADGMDTVMTSDTGLNQIKIRKEQEHGRCCCATQ